jgi:putative membrane protein
LADNLDPRVFFAAERTLLAWVRTGLTVMGLGFVVARFGLVLRLLRTDPEVNSHLSSTLIGVGLVILGSVALAVAAWQHMRFCRTLGVGELPRQRAWYWTVSFAFVLALIGIALALYLVLGSRMS